MFPRADEYHSAKIICGEPEMINPNGYHNIVEILRNLGIKAGMRMCNLGGLREWLLVEVHGVTYSVVINLFGNVFACNICTKTFYGKDTLNEHEFDIHVHSIVIFP